MSNHPFGVTSKYTSFVVLLVAIIWGCPTVTHAQEEAFASQGMIPHPIISGRPFPGRRFGPTVTQTGFSKYVHPFHFQLHDPLLVKRLGVSDDRSRKLMPAIETYKNKSFLTRSTSKDSLPEIAKEMETELRSILSAEEYSHLERVHDRDLLYRFGPIGWKAKSTLAKFGNKALEDIHVEDLWVVIENLHSGAVMRFRDRLPLSLQTELDLEIGKPPYITLNSPSFLAHELQIRSPSRGQVARWFTLGSFQQVDSRVFPENHSLVQPVDSRARMHQLYMLIRWVEGLDKSQNKILQGMMVAVPSQQDWGEWHAKKVKQLLTDVLDPVQSDQIKMLERQFLCFHYGLSKCVASGLITAPNLSKNSQDIADAERVMLEELRVGCVNLEAKMVKSICGQNGKVPDWIGNSEEVGCPMIELLAFHIEDTHDSIPHGRMLE